MAYLVSNLQVKKQASSKSSCFQCVPNTTTQAKCEYGHCNGHSKTEPAAKASANNCKSFYKTNLLSRVDISSFSGNHLVPSTSTGITKDFCCECNQTLVARKLEIENLKTKNKLDHLKLVMQQKKERREARKLKIAPYNTTLETPASSENQSSSAPLQLPMISTMNSLVIPGSSSSLNDSTEESTSSSATATAIATPIPTNNSEIENHLEEVDTAA